MPHYLGKHLCDADAADADSGTPAAQHLSTYLSLETDKNSANRAAVGALDVMFVDFSEKVRSRYDGQHSLNCSWVIPLCVTVSRAQLYALPLPGPNEHH